MNLLNYKRSFCEKFNLSLEQFSYVEKIITFEHIVTDQKMIIPGDFNNYLYFIIEGSSIVYDINDSGVVNNIYLQRESNIIPSTSYIFENTPSKYYYEITANSTIAKISNDDLEMIASSNLAISNWYINILKRSLSIMTSRLGVSASMF